MTRIPLHSLVILVGVPHTGKTAWAQQNFLPHELLSPAQIAQQLTGRTDNFLNQGMVWMELIRQTHVRLQMGQRVVIDSCNLHRQDRHLFQSLADKYGVDLIYVVFPLKDANHTHAAPYHQAVKDIHKQQNVIICTPDQALVCAWHMQMPTRVLAVGDIHGDHVAMKRVCDYATQQGLFLIFLGDIVDYGDHNLKCVKLAHDMVSHNQARIIWGNHERKIGKWMDQDWGDRYSGRLSDANLKTISEIRKLNSERRLRFRAAWKFLENMSAQHVQIDNWMFTHGACHPDAWHMQDHRMPGVAGEWAFFGEVMRTPHLKPDGYPTRLWNWVDQIPDQHLVVVGHDWVDREHMQVVVKQGAQGGKAICVDTGNSKGGRLSAIQIDTNSNTWEARVFSP